MSNTDDRQKATVGEVNTLAGDTEMALAFLKEFHPEGPWCVTAINPDKKGIETRTFFPASEGECRDWITKWNGVWNCYFHVNPVIGVLTEKAKRENIARVVAFHVDVDPVNDISLQSLADQQDAILARFDDKLPKGVPPPTFLVFSGGGYQAFWELAEPIEIGGDLARAEDAKRYNQHLEALFGGDNCHNIDRLMRLPGTINVPDAKKRAKGRVPAMATVVVRKPDRVYPLSAFVQAAISTGLDGKPNKASTTVAVDRANVTRIADLDALKPLGKWTSDDAFRRLGVIIMQGEHPDPAEVAKKTKNGLPPSRSEWLFDVVCNLLRADVPDDVIYSIITDERFGISASVLELKGGAHRYAIKQITSGKEHQIEPALAELNDKHAVMTEQDKEVTVLSWLEDELFPGRRVPLLQSLSAFNARYENKAVQVGTDGNGKPVFKEAGKWWRKHPKRKQYRALRFDPSKPPEFDGYLNLYEGFAVEPVEGDVTPFLEHIYDRIAGRNRNNWGYIISWYAFAVKNPDKRAEVALVFRGGRGTGKGAAVTPLRAIFGQHALHVSRMSQVTGRFNDHIRTTCLLHSDEIVFRDTDPGAGTLKALITEESVMTEAKFQSMRQVPNRVMMIISANDEFAVPAGEDERRYAVFDATPKRPGDEAYFTRLWNWIDNEQGVEKLLHYFQSVPLGDWHPRSYVPQNASLNAQKAHNLKGFNRVWYELLISGVLPWSGAEYTEKRDGHTYEGRQPPKYAYLSTTAVEDYAQRKHREHVGARDVYPVLRDKFGYREDKNPCRGVRLPSLAQCRADWDAAVFPVDWSRGVTASDDWSYQ